MSQELWSSVDEFICSLLAPEDAALEAALKAGTAAGLPPISITANQGKLLMILAHSIRARRILEIGTLGGYSTIWLARAVGPAGRVVTMEIQPGHAEVARQNVARAGCDSIVEIQVGPALDLLPGLATHDPEPFDMVFIDADKAAAPDYFAWALRHTRPGGLIIVDNVVREGNILDAESPDPSIVGIRRLYEIMAGERRAVSTAIQTVGSKGLDGFSISLVTAPA